MKKETNDGKKGGLFKGKSHKKGGIKGIVTDTNQPIEVEGGEVIINKQASKENCEILSEINQSAGGGVALPCEDMGSAITDNLDLMECGGTCKGLKYKHGGKTCYCCGVFHNPLLKAIFGC